jgi:hypothetical protein
MDTAQLNQFKPVYSLKALENHTVPCTATEYGYSETCLTIVSDKVSFVTAAVCMLPCLC